MRMNEHLASYHKWAGDVSPLKLEISMATQAQWS
jgi:hypothetical protein